VTPAADTPLMAQWRRLKEQVGDAWLFFRLGDFYELFGEDAEQAAPVLEVQLTSRDGQTPMCGVPYHALDVYVQRALAAGRSVAIAEQLEDPRTTRGLVERGVVRWVTPGTFVPEEGEAPGPVAALVRRDGRVGLAALWLAEGRAVAEEFHGPRAAEQAVRLLDRIGPVECLVPGRSHGEGLWRGPLVERPELFGGQAGRRLAEALGRRLENAGLDQARMAQQALWAVLRYAEATQGRPPSHVTRLARGPVAGVLDVDRRVARQLDVIGTGGPTVLGWLDCTVTPMGGRLLRQWVATPSGDPAVIRRRQDAVAAWLAAPAARRRLRAALARVGDVERRVARLALGLGQPRDLARLAEAVGCAEEVARIVEAQGAAASPPFGRPDLGAVAARLAAIRPDAGGAWNEGHLLVAGADPEADRLRRRVEDRRAALADLEQQLREETGVRHLKVGYHRTLGYYVEVPRSQRERVPEGWRLKQALATADRWRADVLEQLAGEIAGAETEWLAREEQVARDVLAAVVGAAAALVDWAEWLAWLDVVASWAEVAEVRRLVRPEIGGDRWELEAVRHPLVELAVPHYVPSSLAWDPEVKTAIITGPNMAGKSTFMRAVAVNAWLAHIGSFVAASRWRMPLLDGIYTRIGADDDLVRGQSTFMVEMADMADILRRAGGQSLVVLDELGRGTSTFDGMAIAWAVVEHLARGLEPARRPWTLFATHYQELTQLAEQGGILPLAVDATEVDGALVFLHEVRPGRASRSFGVAVAARAGLPRPVILRAERLLREWEKTGRPAPPPDREQTRWWEPDPLLESLVDDLRRLDVNALTPLDALGWLAEWQRRMRR
jgi:DNA mismatch repair protein MutS